ncbi:hypothetical protein QAD02_002379 [Eretmocerus hayati]|uniref:Uncharacterized protein n=1 Tax=Eretmocerus hayati TaxID=131215 RepID=A0ACC2NIX4_9HYME|nr:hypothetical protein QAD02_002379 [Eretmocerus hayati]
MSLYQFTIAISDAVREALPAAVAAATATARHDSVQQQQQPKPPQFRFREFHSTDNTTVTDYFKRFDWALQLSKISEDQYANYARVHMGSELNDASKFLVSPEEPETCSYKDLCKLLIGHFDSKKNKYAESVKFRSVVQNKEEPVAKFALRLKQAAAHCEYGSFLDRTTIARYC